MRGLPGAGRPTGQTGNLGPAGHTVLAAISRAEWAGFPVSLVLVREHEPGEVALFCSGCGVGPYDPWYSRHSGRRTGSEGVTKPKETGLGCKWPSAHCGYMLGAQ